MIKMGIYKITNLVNNKIYVGSSTNIKKRWRDHKWYLKENKHHNSHLQASVNKYGIGLFKFNIELECDVKLLLIEERKVINKYNSNDRTCGYNVNDPEHAFLNKKHSEETKKKLSLQKIGNKNPMYGKFGNKHPNYDKKMSLKSRNKMSLSKIGIPTNRRNNSKLMPKDIIEIRRMYYVEKISQPKIAIIYYVSYSTINNIITKKTWSNVI